MKQYPRRFILTLAGLIIVSQVLGLICWSLVPRVAPLFLNSAGASSTAIGWILGTLPQALTLILTPIISLWSDKSRTRFGRRRPFLWLSAPVVCLSLVCIGLFSSTLLFLASSLLLFSIASLIPATLLYYLIPDAIPSSCIGKFTAWNGALSSLTAALFNSYCLAWSVAHPALSLSVAACLYGLSMILLTPVHERSFSKPSTPKSPLPAAHPVFMLKEYCHTCFCSKIMIFTFLCLGFNQASMILRTLFGSLFATEDLAIPIANFGRISGTCAILGMAAAIFLGFVIDKINPLKCYLTGSIFVIAISLAGYFLIQSETTYAIFTAFTTLCYSIQSIAYMPILVNVFPAEKFGQFSSANTVICTLMVMGASALGGWLTDYLGYRLMFLWDFSFTLVGTLCLFPVLKAFSSLQKTNQ